MNVQVRYTIVAFAAAVVTVTALGCATMDVRTDHDPRVNLAAYDTFDIKPGQVLVNGTPDNRDTLVRERVEAALQHELQQKGMQEVNQNPDLIATYTAGARSGAVEDDWSGVGYGAHHGGWYGTHPTGLVDEYTQGTLLIDLVDPKTNKLVWRAVVDMGEDNDLRSAKNISTAVDKAFQKYPVSAGGAS